MPLPKGAEKFLDLALGKIKKKRNDTLL